MGAMPSLAWACSRKREHGTSHPLLVDGKRSDLLANNWLAVKLAEFGRTVGSGCVAGGNFLCCGSAEGF